ncbi:MAG: hypothetical protein RIB84_24145 [Sneathiellaceae bacterium]
MLNALAEMAAVSALLAMLIAGPAGTAGARADMMQGATAATVSDDGSVGRDRYSLMPRPVVGDPRAGRTG